MAAAVYASLQVRLSGPLKGRPSFSCLLHRRPPSLFARLDPRSFRPGKREYPAPERCRAFLLRVGGRPPPSRHPRRLGTQARFYIRHPEFHSSPPLTFISLSLHPHARALFRVTASSEYKQKFIQGPEIKPTGPPMYQAVGYKFSPAFGGVRNAGKNIY